MSEARVCIHTHEVAFRDENADRVRTVEVCHACGLKWSTCFAKRLDDEGHEAWGKPGVLWVSPARPIEGSR